MAINCALATAAVLAACGGPVDATPPVNGSSSAAASEQLFPPGSHFDSALYGYGIDLPDGWRTQPAEQRWDGAYGGFGSDTPSSDQFYFQKGYTAWAAAAPTEASLKELLDAENASDVEQHQCEADPPRTAITIGGEQALLEMKHCPTDSPSVLGTAAVIHDGSGYFFYFIHPETVAASDDDQQLFEGLLRTIAFE